MQVRELNEEDLELALVEREKPMIIDFYADWCGPCVLLADELAKVRCRHTVCVVPRHCARLRSVRACTELRCVLQDARLTLPRLVALQKIGSDLDCREETGLLRGVLSWVGASSHNQCAATGCAGVMQVAEDLGDEVSIYKVNTETNTTLSSQLQIQGLPTMIFVGTDPEKPALRTEGLLPAKSIIEIVRKDVIGTPSEQSEAAA